MHNKPVSQHLGQYLPLWQNAPRIWVAFSGGLDSTVLLHALRDTYPQLPLAALHVHHGLAPEADSWAAHCQSQAERWQVPITVVPVTVNAAGESMEAAARAARYAAFRAQVKPGEWLLTAHHQDDQVETVLLRLLRGAGSQGLAAMPRQRALGAGSGELLRPLLSLPRAVLRAYAEAEGLAWIDDPSNAQVDYDRNYLRHDIVPLLGARWPGYRQTVTRSAHWAADSAQLQRDLAALDWPALDERRERLGWSLDLKSLTALSPPRQRNVLREWCLRHGAAVPSAAQMAAIAHELIPARNDAAPLVQWGDWQARRFRQRLYLLPPTSPSPAAAAPTAPFRPPEPLTLADGSVLRAEAVTGSGLRADITSLSPLENQGLTVTLRRGGERCRPHDRAHSQTLKKLLQEAGLPPWLRDRVPLLYCGDTLVAVGDLWVCAGYQAAANEPGWRLSWSYPAIPVDVPDPNLP